MTTGEASPTGGGAGTAADGGVAAFWESRYGRHERVWSGRPNALLVEVAASLTPGRALELGCGEGADAVWLAHRGWRVCAVDVSATALQRASALARAQGVERSIDFSEHDLGRSWPTGSFDLVCASYLQSPVHLPREPILRRAAAAVAAGGMLLVVEHGSGPSGACHRHPHAGFPAPEETLGALQLEPGAWETERFDAVEREAPGHEDRHGPLRDNVIAVRRRRDRPLHPAAVGSQLSGR